MTQNQIDEAADTLLRSTWGETFAAETNAIAIFAKAKVISGRITTSKLDACYIVAKAGFTLGDCLRARA